MKNFLKFVSSEFLSNLLFAIPFLLVVKIFSPMTAVWLIPALFVVPYLVHAIKSGRIAKIFNRKSGDSYYSIADKYMFSLAATLFICLPFTPFVIVLLDSYKLLNTNTNWALLFVSPLAVYIFFILSNSLLRKFSRK
jgi:hypothetical protein